MKKSTILWFISAIILVFNIIIYLTKIGGDTVLLYVSDGLPIVCSFIAVICLLKAFRSFKEFDFVKTTWMLLLIGISFNFVAESTYAVLEIAFKVDMNETFPSVADFFWCIGYIPIIIGLIMMLIGYEKSGFPMGNIVLLVVISLIIFFVLGLVIYFILMPIIGDSETNIITKIFYLFYPISDLIIVIPAAILMYITSLFGAGTISKPWKYLSFGFICFTVADLLYSYLGWQDLYGSGNLIDLIWHFGYLSIGLAGLYQNELISSLKMED